MNFPRRYANRILLFFFSLFLAGTLAAQNPQTSLQRSQETHSSPKQAQTLSDLVVTYLDCGQGDAIVIHTPTGKTYLVDTGPNEKEYGGTFNAGEDVVIPFLQSQGVKSIAGIVISHPHLDHYGGTLSIMENFPVQEFMDSGWPTRAPPYLKVLTKVKEDKIFYRTIKEGDQLSWDPHLKIEIYGPQTEGNLDDLKKKNPNNYSVILKLTYKKIAFLFPGDAESEMEEALVRRFGNKLESHILKSPHHGSRTSSTDEFLEAVNSEIVVISCGRKNRFHHPHLSVLKRLQERELKYYRTDLDGTIEVASDGNRYKIKSFGIGQTPSKGP